MDASSQHRLAPAPDCLRSPHPMRRRVGGLGWLARDVRINRLISWMAVHGAWHLGAVLSKVSQGSRQMRRWRRLAPARCSPAIGPHGWKGALAFPDTVNSLMPWRRCGGAAFLALQVCRYDHQTCEQHESSLGGQAERCAKGVSAIEPWRNCPFARTPPRAAWRVRVVCSAGAARPRKACPAPGSKSGARGGLSAWSSLL